MVFETRTYHWCPTHTYWTMHTPADCMGLNYKKDKMVAGVTQTLPQAMSTHIKPVVDVSIEVKVKEAKQTIVEYCEDYGH